MSKQFLHLFDRHAHTQQIRGACPPGTCADVHFLPQQWLRSYSKYFGCPLLSGADVAPLRSQTMPGHYHFCFPDIAADVNAPAHSGTLPVPCFLYRAQAHRQLASLHLPGLAGIVQILGRRWNTKTPRSQDHVPFRMHNALFLVLPGTAAFYHLPIFYRFQSVHRVPQNHFAALQPPKKAVKYQPHIVQISVRYLA